MVGIVLKRICTETDLMEKCHWITVQKDSEVFSGVTCSPRLLKSELDYLSLGAPFRSGKEREKKTKLYSIIFIKTLTSYRILFY